MAAWIDALASEALQGNEVASKKLFTTLTPRMWGLFRHLGSSAPETEDLIQETWTRVFKHRAEFDQPRHFEPYIFTIAVRLWIDLRRREKPPADVPAAARRFTFLPCLAHRFSVCGRARRVGSPLPRTTLPRRKDDLGLALFRTGECRVPATGWLAASHARSDAGEVRCPAEPPSGPGGGWPPASHGRPGSQAIWPVAPPAAVCQRGKPASCPGHSCLEGRARPRGKSGAGNVQDRGFGTRPTCAPAAGHAAPGRLRIRYPARPNQKHWN